MDNRYEFFIAGRARNKDNILRICDLFDKYNISYYCFLKNEDDWGYGNKDQTPEEKQQEFESLGLKSEVVLNLIKAEKTYAIKIPKVVQDTAFGSGSLYFVCGYSKEGELWKIDMKTKTAKVIDLTKYGLNGEPEGLEEYEGNIIMSFSNRSVYKIKINE